MAGIITTTQIPINAVSKFQQASAPVNWTRITTYNDLTLRLVNTSNTVVTSAQPFSTLFTPTAVPFGATALTLSNPGSTQATTLSAPQLPPHTHTQVPSPLDPYRQFSGISAVRVNAGGPCFPATQPAASINFAPLGGTTAGSTYGGGSHVHPQTFSGPGSIPFSPGTVSFAIKYIDLILCKRTV